MASGAGRQVAARGLLMAGESGIFTPADVAYVQVCTGRWGGGGRAARGCCPAGREAFAAFACTVPLPHPSRHTRARTNAPPGRAVGWLRRHLGWRVDRARGRPRERRQGAAGLTPSLLARPGMTRALWAVCAGWQTCAWWPRLVRGRGDFHPLSRPPSIFQCCSALQTPISLFHCAALSLCGYSEAGSARLHKKLVKVLC